ncbi:MAG: tRNA (adenosine(37)-N6)-threonylcarbamoyltransferase complex transferase subunit TsaD [Deltaproteobacteria bacterium]|nr:tRNA (adenosine(37)-N6)-threonylcarbamoyltransferase complex transferase subunit TsaD [Deltaproteobacteria bacterium]
MYILGIDTSCDDTSCAILENGTLKSNIVFNQNEVHDRFGGIVPEIAARMHTESISFCVKKAMEEADVSKIDMVGVTVGPGLMPSLLVGVCFAKAFCYARHIPIIGVDHIEGHINAIFLEHDVEYPFLALVVSGGHTNLYLVSEKGYKLLGKTLDDAAGEAFDKVSRLMGLSFPGGPIIDRLSKTGDSAFFNIPRALEKKETLDFSFSGVKTAVKKCVEKLGKLSKTDIANISASFQESVVDVIVDRLLKAVDITGVGKIVVSGGVACNSHLKEVLFNICNKRDIKLYFPSHSLCTDNGAMIAEVACKNKDRATFNYDGIDAKPHLSL